jgi:hypothetical protein
MKIEELSVSDLKVLRVELLNRMSNLENRLAAYRGRDLQRYKETELEVSLKIQELNSKLKRIDFMIDSYIKQI